ncbi:MAG: ATP-binding protein [Gammaproteobacteria bacterium]|nr:ATP-binding protein [Gammaproteobacteria bacterium]MDH3433307.1 ATP-binding protein [Gammaproteobacteria bacterium]
MVYRRFAVVLAIRLVVVGLAIAAVVWLLLQPGHHGATVLAVGILVIFATELWWFISRTNREVVRFLDAARYADYSQRFSLEGIGAGFGELGETFTDILDRMYEQRADQEVELRQLRALIDHIPVPLLTVHTDKSITLQNNAARRLFGASHITRLSDLRQFGSGFHDAVAEAVPGNRELVTFSVDDVEYRLTLATTENIVAGDSSRLVSLQDIQSELDITQAQAWQDLVRVLTHEIMNSITPVTSLAKTAAHVIDDVIDKAGPDSSMSADLDDLRDAVYTVARRSDSLMQFVHSYRQLTRLAPPEKKRVNLADLFASVTRLAEAEWPGSESILSKQVEPAELDVYADRDLLEPVLLNLLRNALQATAEQEPAKIDLRGHLNRRGNVVIDLCDNGPGVPEDIARQIFVPFFTTKDQGSGVGLALARQVMTAHGGFIRVGQNEGGGARFTLTF